MDREKLYVQFVLQFMKNHQKAHGIRSSGQTDDDAVAGDQHMVLPYEFPDTLQYFSVHGYTAFVNFSRYSYKYTIKRIIVKVRLEMSS